MRLNINLASLKYEDVRRFYVRWGVALAALAVLAMSLAVFSYLNYSRAKASAQQTRNVQEKIDALQKQRDQMKAIEIAPINRDVTQQKKYWNTQIAKRSFSWTQLLNDMQKIMPNRAFLQSVQPELTLDNRLKLRLMIIGEKREDARELEKRMETSPRFVDPHIVSESVVKETKPGLPPTYQFEIETFYRPTGPAISPPLGPSGQPRGQARLVRLHSRLREAM
jgi:type IV pilus assembly protein PilN